MWGMYAIGGLELVGGIALVTHGSQVCRRWH